MTLLPSPYRNPALSPWFVYWRACTGQDGCRAGRNDLLVYWTNTSEAVPCAEGSKADLYHVDVGLNSTLYQTLPTPCFEQPDPDWDSWGSLFMPPGVASNGSSIITFCYAYGTKQRPPRPRTPIVSINEGILWGYQPGAPATKPDALLVPVEVIVVLCGLGLALPLLCGVWKLAKGRQHVYSGGVQLWGVGRGQKRTAAQQAPNEATTLLSMAVTSS